MTADKRAKSAAYMREYLQRPGVRARELERRRAARRANPDKYRAQERASKARNHDAVLERKRRYRQKAADKVREYNREYSKKNAEKMRQWRKEWDARNPGKVRAIRSARRAREISATPSWADMAAIAEIYVRCAEMNKAGTETFHVDHVIPLRGKLVCGLHVHTNLQIIPCKENWAKSNKLVAVG